MKTRTTNRKREQEAHRWHVQPSQAHDSGPFRTVAGQLCQQVALETIFRYSPVGLFVIDRDGRFLRVNARLAEINGKSIEEHLGRTVREILPDLGEPVFDLHQQVLQTGQPVLDVELRGGTPKHPSTDGTWLVSYFPLTDEAQEVVGLVGAVVELTDRKRVEEALQESELRFRTLTEANILGVITCEGHKISEVNDSFRTMLGLSADALPEEGLDWRQIAPPDCAEILHAIFREVTTTGRFEPRELELCRQDGARVPVLVAGALINPASQRWIGYTLDMTRMKWAQRQVETLNLDLLRKVSDLKTAQERLEQSKERIEAAARELARSNRDLEQFAYVASHDLQEPLRTVTGFVQLLRERCHGHLDAQADEYIDYVVEGAQRMRVLIDDLLAYSRVGTRGEGRQPVPVQQALEIALAGLKRRLEESSATVQHGDLPVVMCEPTQLSQLFQNLISNALKFRGPEGPHIEVGALPDDDSWLLWVRDNGIGIDPRYHERIFQIFQRLHTRREYPGTGVGLAICKKIVERQGGRIWVESRPGEGATFYFTLPRFPEDGENVDRENVSPASDRSLP